MLIPLTNRKHVTLKKTKSYKDCWFFFLYALLGLASAALFKSDLDTFANRAKAGFGVDALSPLLGREAPLTAQLIGSLLPHPLPVQPRLVLGLVLVAIMLHLLHLLLI